MFETIIEQLKNPVTSMVEKSKEEGIKKGTIKLVIISAVMALINVITSIMSIFSKYSSKSWYADIYEKSELSKMKWDAIKGISYNEELNSICIDGKGEKKTIWKSEKRKERSPRKKAINRIILYLPYDSKDKFIHLFMTYGKEIEMVK